MPHQPPFVTIFLACDAAAAAGVLIRRAEERGSRFQNWFEDRLAGTGLMYERTGANAFPDFVLRDYAEGYEVKGLAVPGRWRSGDANSQVPRGSHAGREVYYVFGRYPNPRRVRDEDLRVVDLVMCHGTFINPEAIEPSRNKSVRGFGGFGDILVRNRRMYVPPTPYALAEGTEGTRTLIVPADTPVGSGLEAVGRLVRREAGSRLVGYDVAIATGDLKPVWEDNPSAGREHAFIAYRAVGGTGPPVRLAPQQAVDSALDEAESELPE